jgi:hypothetical protein
MKDTSIYAGIVKMDDNGDGTLTVYGKATDDSIDIDQQICDPAWLDKAMPEWFMSGGNIREQHSNIAAGVAQEYEQKKDGHYISALVVDPVSVKKVKSRVLKGFSIGIKSPRVVRDQKAANGRIIDGQIVEVSLVDRPANPNCQLVLAKSVNGEKSLTKVEELVETNIEKEATEETMPMSGEAKNVPSRDEMVERYAAARKALDEVNRMCKECGYDDIEKQYGETAEQETEEGSYPEAAEQEVSEASGEKPLDKEVVVENNEMADKAVSKCLECGCNQVGNDHGGGTIVLPDGTTSNMTAATMVSEKTITTIVPPSTIEDIGTVIEDEDSDEADSAEKSLLADGVNAVIEKAVKSAMASVQAEIAELKSAKEAVENKAASLETELATAKSLAIGGGPKRTTIATGAKTNNEWKSKADLYLAKASATTDNDLAKGYREMAKDYLAKAATEAQA